MREQYVCCLELNYGRNLPLSLDLAMFPSCISQTDGSSKIMGFSRKDQKHNFRNNKTVSDL